MKKQSLYEILEVSVEASQEEIKLSYRRLSKIHHPDKTGGDDTKMKELSLAYEILGNEERRKRYDETGSLDTRDPFEDRYNSTVIPMFLKIVSELDNEYTNPIDKMLRILEGQENELRSTLVELMGQRTLIEKRIPRIKRGDLLMLALKSHLSAIEDGIKRCEGDIEFHKKAIDRVREYVYEVDAEPQKDDVTRIWIAENAATQDLQDAFEEFIRRNRNPFGR